MAYRISTSPPAEKNTANHPAVVWCIVDDDLKLSLYLGALGLRTGIFFGFMSYFDLQTCAPRVTGTSEWRCCGSHES